MARPKDFRFYEAPPPEALKEENKWIADYDKNSRLLFEHMEGNGAGHTALHVTLRCLEGLRDYLLERKLPYSPEIAGQWLNETGPCLDKGSRAALARLSDLFMHGSVSPVNAFPRALPYTKHLRGPWPGLLSEFMKTQEASTASSIQQVRNCVARFLYRIQESGITGPLGITYGLLEEYCLKDGHRSANSSARYTYAIGDILLFMADKGLCEHGLGWYPYFRMHGRIFRIADFTASQAEKLEKLRPESQACPAEAFSDTAKAFLREFRAAGYSGSPCHVADYTLHNLLLFLEMHGFGYHPEIADIWLEHEKGFHEKDGWKQSRRILNLFELYAGNGGLLPQVIFREKPLLLECLPAWCRAEAEWYLSLKTREGWEKSTLVMIRSSITRFCRFLADAGLKGFSEMTPEILKDFNLHDRHQTAEGKNAYNGRIRKFIQYLERKGTVPYGLHQALMGSSAPREKIVVVLTEEERAVIKEKHAKTSSPMELRDRAMVLLGIKMGLRASDIVTILLTDIDWERQTLRVIQEKTDHEIRLPMPTEVGNAIYLYITKGRPNGKTSSRNLFVKGMAPFDPVTRGVCSDALKRALPGRKVPGSAFHVTRKTYATDQLRGGAGKRVLAELLGQKDTQSLRHYLQFDEERMRMCPLSLAESGLLMGEGRYGDV